MCELNLENPALHMACSRVEKPSDLFVYAPEERTKDIVHLNALQ